MVQDQHDAKNEDYKLVIGVSNHNDPEADDAWKTTGCWSTAWDAKVHDQWKREGSLTTKERKLVTWLRHPLHWKMQSSAKIRKSGKQQWKVRWSRYN